MARLSVTTAWNETAALVKAKAGAMLPLAFIAVAVPSAVVRAIGPRSPTPDSSALTTPFLVALAVALILAVIGNLAINRIAIRPEASLREAIAEGVRRAPVLLAASLLVGCAVAALCFIVILLVFGASAAAEGEGLDGAEVIRAAGLTALLLAPAFFYLAGRLALIAPIAATERGGPFTIIARSWRLTRPAHFRMLALVAILALLAIVLQRAAESLFGILLIALAGPPEPGSLSAILILLVLALLNTVLISYGVTLVARVYAQLADKEES